MKAIKAHTKAMMSKKIGQIQLMIQMTLMILVSMMIQLQMLIRSFRL